MQCLSQFRLGSHNLPIVTGDFPGANTLQELTRYAHTVVALLLPVKYSCFMNAQFFSHLRYAALFTADTTTMRSLFAQQDHMQVFKFVLDCLDFLRL